MAAPLLLDLVLETATNPGTASFVLNGAVQDRRSFASAAPGGGQVFYFADDGTQAEWGVGVLTVGTPNTLSRQTITGTTQNTAQALNFTGTVRVYSWVPAFYTPVLDGNGTLALRGDLSAQNGTLQTLTVTTICTVPRVTDWGSQQAAAVIDVQNRFINRDVGGANLPVLNIQLVNAPTSDNSAAYFQFLTTWGALIVPTSGNVANQIRSYAQPIGDYATNGSLNNAVNNLNSSIATKQPVGTYVTTQTATSGSSGDLKINAVNFSNSVNAPYLSGYKPDGSQTSYVLAQLSDLPLDRSEKIIRMSVTGAKSLTRINFSSGFSGTPQVIAQNRNGSDGNCHAYSTDSGGFTLWINGGGTTDIDVIAVGPK